MRNLRIAAMTPNRGHRSTNEAAPKEERTNMMKDRNEIEPPPVDDDFEDLGPEDLELIQSSYGPVVEEDDYEEWPESVEDQWRKDEQRQWLQHLVDVGALGSRVVELGPFFAAVFERSGELTLVRDDQHEPIQFFDPRPYNDAEIRERIEGYLASLRGSQLDASLPAFLETFRCPCCHGNAFTRQNVPSSMLMAGMSCSCGAFIIVLYNYDAHRIAWSLTKDVAIHGQVWGLQYSSWNDRTLYSLDDDSLSLRGYLPPERFAKLVVYL